MVAESPGTDSDRASRLILPEAFAELAGAILMDLFGPLEQEEIPGGEEKTATGAGGGGRVALVFYPDEPLPTTAEVLALLPAAVRESGQVRLETREVSRAWVDGWREHFYPIVIAGVRIRPPWEPALATGVSSGEVAGCGSARGGMPPVDVVINPGLGFGTGLHPTTRGTLRLLQSECCSAQAEGRGRLVDVGTGSGVLAIAAAKLGWKPVVAFDNDPCALQCARENVAANGAQEEVEVLESEASVAAPDWFVGATVLANMTLKPVLTLVRRFSDGPAAVGRPLRMVVSGILAGGQEQELLSVAGLSGFAPGLRAYEDEWVSLELLPMPSTDD